MPIITDPAFHDAIHRIFIVSHVFLDVMFMLLKSDSQIHGAKEDLKVIASLSWEKRHTQPCRLSTTRERPAEKPGGGWNSSSLLSSHLCPEKEASYNFQEYSAILPTPASVALRQPRVTTIFLIYTKFF